MAVYFYDGTDLADMEKHVAGGMNTAIDAYDELVTLSGQTGVLGDAGTKLQEVLGGTQETMSAIKQKATDINEGVAEKKKQEAATSSQVMEALKY